MTYRMNFGVFIPQGWKLELSSIADPVDKWDKAVEVAVLAWAKAWSDKNNVSLTLTGLSIRVQGDQAVASFRQVDSAGNPSKSSPQTLYLKKSGKQWLVTREAAGL